jgi:hypothetical protein
MSCIEQRGKKHTYILLENDGEPGWQHAQYERDGGQQHHDADARHQQVVLGAHGVRCVCFGCKVSSHRGRRFVLTPRFHHEYLSQIIATCANCAVRLKIRVAVAYRRTLLLLFDNTPKNQHRANVRFESPINPN